MQETEFYEFVQQRSHLDTLQTQLDEELQDLFENVEIDRDAV